MRDVGLVSCVNSKRDESAKPRNLYTSSYFEKMRAYAESNHDDWFILSAKHGLLDPEGEPIEPYDKTLSGAPKDRKQAWAERVFEELREANVLDSETTLVIHAGKDYYEELLPLLKEAGVSVEIPTEGLRIGEKQSWYKERI